MNLNIKKTILIFSVCCSMLVSLNSCYDDKMKWGRDPSYGEVTVAELPLALSEKISRYDFLLAYLDETTNPGFKLGVGIDPTLYMTDDTYKNIVDKNFNDITFGNEMKHRFIVGSDGQINTSNVDGYINALNSAGLSVYGHTLVWHKNQNASYLNGLIAPTIIPGPAGSNLLDLTGLQDGSFSGGWNKLNPGAGISVVDGEGLSSTAKAVKMVSSSSSSNEWDLQLESPSITVVSGHTYQISFYIKSDKTGSGRISFDSGVSNRWPWKDWYGTGNASASFATTSQWQQVKFTVDDFTGTTFKMYFDLGKLPDVTYYIDVDNIIVTDLDAAPVEVNYVENGDFEKGDLTGWSKLNVGAGTEVTNTEKFSGSYSVKMTSSSSSANAWDLQLESSQMSLDASKTYTFSFYVKSDVAGKGRVSFPGGINGNQYPWMNWTGSGASEAFTTSAGTWTLISVDLTNTSNVKLSFDMGYLPNVTYYIDDIKVVEKTAAQNSKSKKVKSKPYRAGPVIIEKTDEEKAQIIGDAMKSFITQMVNHFKGKVHAWEVVNEPMKEGGSLRDGNVTDASDDDFYWVKYLGKDYAVTAFKLVRELDPSVKLFINDYNLESSPAKLDGLIEYVGYIESKGAVVDGIGTQMHITLASTDTANVASMFKKLAATGKLIKITELDVRLGTNSPTADQLIAQGDMYRLVLDMYMKYIPAAQRYGVTVWCVSDNEKEHEYWLPDESPNLWNINYERKPAYKGFADGLAGKDVSLDFSGELIY
ncbi:Beta-1,4-xylanase [uncultured Paludibacter sp.]|uniref:endo-1,4-beta-xylanase n=1 Tax=uncultured Paludibacter sp. TaxID=497635 RepID=A0A653AJZ1_9BACT|nr:Beta-1,4-xylanase [uncultured Paludibacter sp.]